MSGEASSNFVKLISSSNHIFYVEKKVAMVSGMIRATLQTTAFQESESQEISFPELDTPVLEKVIEYFHYKHRYNNSRVPIPEFQIAPDMAIDVLIAANYLEC